ncbi:MAG: hypothetical protein EA384_04910 [Spirochaetaceae bacterium]|nr:MAG: hypothetical protein EA384_04910 [Spirochaetaceae bacterium]
MIQIYLLSVLTNIVAGITLSFDGLDEKVHLSSIFNRDLFESVGFRLGLGIATFLVGFFKFLSVTNGDVPVVGDLIPALSGVIQGLILLVLYYRARSDVSSPMLDSIDKIFVQNRSMFGTAGILIGALHFLFPSVLFL